jgi:hypothetical protein
MDHYKGEPVRIHVDETVKPIALPHRRIPFHVRKQVEKKLEQLENEGIVERAEGPTPWVSPIVVIPKLDKLFATFGTPLVVRTDNEPPFNGDEFVKFSQVLGFKHRKVTPLWPRANGEVERFVKTLKKYIKAAKTEGKN